MPIWECKIGTDNDVSLPDGADGPMRKSLEDAFRSITGEDPQFLFSGWGATLTPGERAVVDNTEPELPAAPPDDFRQELARTINRFSRENGSNTPDFILADFLTACLAAFDATSRAREMWYGVESRPGQRVMRGVSGPGVEARYVEHWSNKLAPQDMQQFWNEVEKWLKGWRDIWAACPGSSHADPVYESEWNSLNQVLDDMRDKAACGMLPWQPWPDNED